MHTYPLQQFAVKGIRNVGRLSGRCTGAVVDCGGAYIGSWTLIFLFAIVVIGIRFVSGIRDVALRH